MEMRCGWVAVVRTPGDPVIWLEHRLTQLSIQPPATGAATPVTQPSTADTHPNIFLSQNIFCPNLKYFCLSHKLLTAQPCIIHLHNAQHSGTLRTIEAFRIRIAHKEPWWYNNQTKWVNKWWWKLSYADKNCFINILQCNGCFTGPPFCNCMMKC